MEALKEKGPEIIFDPSKLRTKADWIAAGKLVFESDIRFFPVREQPLASEVPWPLGKNGMLPGFGPGYRYYVRTKGVLELGINACSGCHTRVIG